MTSLNRRKFLGGTVAALSAAALQRPLWGLVKSALVPGNAPEQLLIGVDYYPDQTPEALWEEDARMIADVGFTNVRIAEFAWALMEPAEGKFDFAWLHRAVDILHKHNVAIILGTPSAAPPPWLTVKYPEVVEVDAQGLPLHPGGRRFTCPTNKTNRRLSLAVATEMARSFVNAPGVIGWQIDNEFTLSGSPRCYCNYCRAGFQEWLKNKYNTLDNINQSWGTVFWSQTYTDFAQIPLPLSSGGDANPGLALDYDRYQSYANVSFQDEQLAMLRSTCPKHFITTNNVGVPVDFINERDLYSKLDFVAFDNYPGFFEMHLHARQQPASPEIIGTTIAMAHDFGRSLKSKPFMIMEEQSGKAGQKTFSPQPEKGQVRLWTYQAVAHGAMGVNYFRWDTATFGAEEYWHGILNHDRSKSPAFDEIKQTVKELKSMGAEVLNSSYPAEIALVFDYDCDWAVQIQQQHFRLNYTEQVTSWYGAVNAGHTGIDVIVPGADFAGYKILLTPVAYVMSEAQAKKIRDFVQHGGVFVSNFRLGAKTETSQIVRTPLPGLLRDVMGVTVEDYVPIYSGKPQVKFSGTLAGADGECGIWMDILQPSTAEVLATYASSSYEGKPAITMNRFGKGKAVYVGPDLDKPSLARVLRSLCASAGIKQPLEAPSGLEVTVRKAGNTQWIFLLNHTAAPQSVTITNSYADVITGESHTGKVDLNPYGVRVLRVA